MEIRQITEDKDNYLEMLLIADPQENMIRRYLDKSDMFVLEDAGEVLTIGVVGRGNGPPRRRSVAGLRG